MKMSAEVGNLASALAMAQAAMKGVSKDADNPFFKSKYATLASHVEAIKAPLAANNLSYAQFVVTNDSGVGVETLLMHSSGEWICGDPYYVPVDKQNAQGFGSALTYCRRYSLAAITGIAPEDDDDGNAAAAATPKKNPLNAHAEAIEALYPDGDMLAYVTKQKFDKDTKQALWKLLTPDVRKAITAQQEASHGL